MGKWVKKPPAKTLHYCYCGNVGIKRVYSAMWSCQRCIDLDRFVTQKHIEVKLLQGQNNEVTKTED